MSRQILMFDPDCRAFVNVDYSVLIDLLRQDSTHVFESIEYFFAIGNGTQATYVLPWAAVSKPSLVITLDGVKQLDQAYTYQVVNGTTLLTFAEPIPLDMQIEVLGFQVIAPRRVLRYYSGELTQPQTQITIPWIASAEQAVMITIDGVKQHVESYSFSWQSNNSTVITLTEPALPGSEIEVLGFYGFNASMFRFVVHEGDGVQDTFAAPWYVADPTYLYVTIDGVKQHQSAFTVSVNSLGISEITFAEPIPLGSNIEILSFDPRLVGCVNTCGGGVSATNLGQGAPVLNSVTQNSLGITDLSFRSIVPGTGIDLEVSPSTITINSTLSPTELVSVGSGESLLNLDNEFKSLVAGDGITLTSDSETITITADTQDLVDLITTNGTFARQLSSVGNELLDSVSLVSKGTAQPNGTFEVYGLRAGVGINITLVDNDIVISDKNGGNYRRTADNVFVGLDENVVGIRAQNNVLVTLPDLNIVGVAKTITIKDELGNAGMVQIRITGQAGQLIDGANYHDLAVAREAITLYASDDMWHILSRYRP